MKVFEVITEEDGHTIKEPGVVETKIHRVSQLFAAQNISKVWEAIGYLLRDPEKEVVAVNMVAHQVTILEEPNHDD